MEEDSLLSKTHKKSATRLHPTVLFKQQKVLSVGTASYADGFSSLEASEIMFCKTVGLCASFYLCCLWGLSAYYKTVIIISNLSPSVPCREAQGSWLFKSLSGL